MPHPTLKTILLTAALALLPAAAPAEPLDEGAAARLVDAATDRPEADRALDGMRMPAKALAFMQVEPGERWLDMFAGGGYYTVLLADAVGSDGFVVAQNPAGFSRRDGIVAAVGARGYGDAIPNAAPMNVDFGSLTLAPASLDGVLFHLVYHDLYFESAELGLPRSDPQTVLAEIHRALRPGGMVTVIDHGGTGEDARAEVAATHRIDPALVERDFRQAGFQLVAREAFFDNPQDDGTRSVFDPDIRGRTDRFALRFAKAADPNVTPALSEDMAMAEKPCDPAKADRYLGETLLPALRETLKEVTGAKDLRAYETGSIVSMDYREERLNVELDPNTRRIVKLSCG